MRSGAKIFTFLSDRAVPIRFDKQSVGCKQNNIQHICSRV